MKNPKNLCVKKPKQIQVSYKNSFAGKAKDPFKTFAYNNIVQKMIEKEPKKRIELSEVIEILTKFLPDISIRIDSSLLLDKMLISLNVSFKDQFKEMKKIGFGHERHSRSLDKPIPSNETRSGLYLMESK